MPTLRNLVLVVLDDLIEDDLTYDRAPNWHDLVAAGQRWGATYSMPVCSQSRACLLFGRYGRSLGITVAMNGETGPAPAAGTPTLAELLRAAGYKTALAGKWHLGPHADTGLPLGAPLSRGFDAWVAGSIDNLASYTGWQRYEDDEPPVLEHQYAPVAQLEAARAWWDAAGAHSKFLWLAPPLPHAPFHVPPPELLDGYSSSATPPSRRRYELMLRAADWILGQLRTWPGMANAIVCVVGDNGTPINAVGPTQSSSRVKTTTYEDGVRVPCAWYGAEFFEAGTQRAAPRHLVDVPATLLAIANLPVPNDWDGTPFGNRSASELVLSEATLGDGTLERAVVSPATRLKLRRTGELPEEAYDLAVDPIELQNVVDLDEYEGALESMRAVLYAEDP